MEARGDSQAQAEIIGLSLAQELLSSHSLPNCSIYTTSEPPITVYQLLHYYMSPKFKIFTLGLEIF